MDIKIFSNLAPFAKGITGSAIRIWSGPNSNWTPGSVVSRATVRCACARSFGARPRTGSPCACPSRRRRDRRAHLRLAQSCFFNRFRQPLGIANGHILRAAVGMRNQPATMDGPPIMQCLVEGIEHNARMSAPACPPADDTASESINDESHVDEALPRRQWSKKRRCASPPRTVRRLPIACRHQSRSRRGRP
ncbi:Protein of unknown function (DUF2699) [Rhizobium sp. CF142]|nr:Protein of unknown function (DUF2699) [Rhizobium sp. CF142]